MLKRPADDCIKYLGITIQSDLKWDAHIQNVTRKASQTIGMLKRNIRIRDHAPRELAYKALVRPKVEYASSVWDPPIYDYTNDENQSGLSEKVEKIQRRGARFVYRSYRHSADSTKMVENLKWQPLGWTSVVARIASSTFSSSRITSPQFPHTISLHLSQTSRVPVSMPRVTIVSKAASRCIGTHSFPGQCQSGTP